MKTITVDDDIWKKLTLKKIGLKLNTINAVIKELLKRGDSEDGKVFVVRRKNKK